MQIEIGTNKNIIQLKNYRNKIVRAKNSANYHYTEKSINKCKGAWSVIKLIISKIKC